VLCDRLGGVFGFKQVPRMLLQYLFSGTTFATPCRSSCCSTKSTICRDVIAFNSTRWQSL
jgi:hypothetical protein